jgi:EPS-associated MarR family transcriptional regulator
MIEYKLIRELEKNPSHTQRTLADKLDISLGKVNYVLAGFMEKGFIKAKKLKNNPDKIRWQYLLTPAGIKNKIKISRDYLYERLEEFSRIQQEIAELKQEINEPSPKVR